jgi:hypothetical protein
MVLRTLCNMWLWLLNLYNLGLYVGWIEILRDFTNYWVCMNSSTLIYLLGRWFSYLSPYKLVGSVTARPWSPTTLLNISSSTSRRPPPPPPLWRLHPPHSLLVHGPPPLMLPEPIATVLASRGEEESFPLPQPLLFLAEPMMSTSRGGGERS